MYVGACMLLCAQVHAFMCMWKPEDNLGCRSSGAIHYLFETGFLIGPATCQLGEVGRPASPRDPLAPAFQHLDYAYHDAYHLSPRF